MGVSKKLTTIEETRSVCACVSCSKSKETLNGWQDAEELVYSRKDERRMKKISMILGALMVCTSGLMALPMGSMMSGQTNFNNGNLIGSVEYAVYAPGQYSGTTLFPSTDYVYAYRVFDDLASTVTIDFFSVGLVANAIVGNLTYEASAGDIIPGFQAILSETVINLFMGSAGPITSGKQSAILLFSSPMQPTMGFGAVSGGQSGGEIISLAAPIPEPATLTLLTLGGLFAVRSRRS